MSGDTGQGAWEHALECKRDGKRDLVEFDKVFARHPRKDEVRATVLDYCHQAALYDGDSDVHRHLVQAEESFINRESRELLAAAQTLLAKFDRQFPGDTSGFGLICSLTRDEQVSFVNALVKVEQAMLGVRKAADQQPLAPSFYTAGGVRYTKPVHHQEHMPDRATALGLGLTELFRHEVERPAYYLAALLIKAELHEDLTADKGRPLKGRIEALKRRNPGIRFSGFLDPRGWTEDEA